MESRPKIESGIDLLARLIRRPSLKGLENRLFDDGPHERSTIELCGQTCSGKTLLLTQLIANCILPARWNEIPIEGRGAAAVLINTDHHFSVSKLAQLMHGIAERACRLNGVEYSADTVSNRMILPALDNLAIVDCYDNNQFKFTTETLDNILMNDHGISLIAIDSISSFYWLERESGGVWSIDRYLQNLLKTIQLHTFRHNVVVIYTRPHDFASKGQKKSMELSDEAVAGKINYRIELGTRCVIETARDSREMRFKISDKGITWIMDDREFVNV